jgi:xanthine dehydrogenase iron-sulfur cluster and FAD-binding subunit A
MVLVEYPGSGLCVVYILPLRIFEGGGGKDFECPKVLSVCEVLFDVVDVSILAGCDDTGLWAEEAGMVEELVFLRGSEGLEGIDSDEGGLGCGEEELSNDVKFDGVEAESGGVELDIF